jgi:hypothetical protein
MNVTSAAAIVLPFAALIAIPLGGGPAFAQPPAAVVEDVIGTPLGAEFMDYVAPGKIIVLGPKDGVVLAYLQSCWRETITGGSVKIGAEYSEVDGGSVERAKVRCDAGKMALTAELGSKSGAMVLRNARAVDPRAQFTLYGASPLVVIPQGLSVVIERLDAAGERYELTRAAHRSFYDFAEEGKAIAAGGLYRASAGGAGVVFSVDADAKPGRTPLAGRLLQIRPPG